MTYSDFHAVIIENWHMAQKSIRDNAIEGILRDSDCQQIETQLLDRVVRIVEDAK